jgi:hypothetical protein
MGEAPEFEKRLARDAKSRSRPGSGGETARGSPCGKKAVGTGLQGGYRRAQEQARRRTGEAEIGQLGQFYEGTASVTSQLHAKHA